MGSGHLLDGKLSPARFGVGGGAGRQDSFFMGGRSGAAGIVMIAIPAAKQGGAGR